MGMKYWVAYKMIMFLKDFIEYKKICAHKTFFILFNLFFKYHKKFVKNTV